MTHPPRIAILDSGVHLAHPHIGQVVGGVSVSADGLHPTYVDRLGHGTAVAALIHHLHPTAELLAVQIFTTRLATSLPIILRALTWCFEKEVDIINLSLGTHNPAHRPAFENAVDIATRAGIQIISAFEHDGVLLLPGSLPGVHGVIADPDCPEGEYRTVQRGLSQVFAAPPYPRAIPGLPRQHNLQGVSFAVAHVSAHRAHALQFARAQSSPSQSHCAP